MTAGARTGAADGATQRTVDAVWRIESARLVGGLARIVRDVGLAEDLAQDALLAALQQWPQSGVPDNPGAWLMATAKHRAIDVLRRRTRLEHKHERLAHELSIQMAIDGAELDGALDDDIGDEVLTLMFTCAHPVLSPQARSALTLRAVGGLTTPEIARAFLVPEKTLAQRIVRAKKTLAAAGARFEVPQGEERAERLASVLGVIYLIFNEGYAATAGEHWARPALCEDALRLGRVLAALAAEESEVHGLLALMELQASRLAVRTARDGAPVLLLDQDRTRWDRLLIGRGLAALERAEALAERPGPYTLQAAIAGCHARAATAADTDWPAIARIYEELAITTGSAVVELNRAVAVAMVHGPAAGLAIVEELAEEPALRAYHHLPSVRGDLLARLGRHEQARAELERAASLTENQRERALLLERAAECARASGSIDGGGYDRA